MRGVSEVSVGFCKANSLKRLVVAFCIESRAREWGVGVARVIPPTYAKTTITTITKKYIYINILDI